MLYWGMLTWTELFLVIPDPDFGDPPIGDPPLKWALCYWRCRSWCLCAMQSVNGSPGIRRSDSNGKVWVTLNEKWQHFLLICSFYAPAHPGVAGESVSQSGHSKVQFKSSLNFLAAQFQPKNLRSGLSTEVYTANRMYILSVQEMNVVTQGAQS